MIDQYILKTSLIVENQGVAETTDDENTYDTIEAVVLAARTFVKTNIDIDETIAFEATIFDRGGSSITTSFLGTTNYIRTFIAQPQQV